MAMVIKKTIEKAGRNYTVSLNGASDVSARYQVILEEPLAIDELPTTFAGVPAIGSQHPNRPGYYALSYEVTQPDGAAKNTLDVIVKYGPSDITVVPPEEQQPGYTEIVTEWGWDDGTGEKELVTSLDTPPVAVLNSAGDPFDSVPSVYTPTPTFTKVLKSTVRKADYTEYLCTVNDRAITIGAMTCPAHTLLCSIAEKRLIGEEKFPYEYTVHLRYRSNKVKQNNSATTVEIGWDVGIVDAGMRQKRNDGTGKLEIIQVPSGESGKPAAVTAPELLDGQGRAVDRTGSHTPSPYILTFAAYPRKEFPAWFYSEPPVPTPPTPPNNNTQGGN